MYYKEAPIDDWYLVPEKSTDIWKEYKYMYKGEKEFYWKYVIVKWDGCMHMYTASNEPYGGPYGEYDSPLRTDDNSDYQHICGIDDHIKVMFELRKKIKRDYGKNDNEARGN